MTSAPGATAERSRWVRVRDRVVALTNPATVWGSVMLVGALLVLGLPDLSVLAVELVLGVVLIAVGVLEIAYAVSGHGLRLARSRWGAGLRGPFAALCGGLIFLGPADAVVVLLFFAGAYLVVRSLLALLIAALRRRRDRLMSNVLVLAVGLLCVASPTVLSRGIVLFGAVAVAIVGGIVTAYGVRAAAHDEREALLEATIPTMVADWVRRADIGTDRRVALTDTLYFERPARAEKLSAWWTILLLSASIATFGILQDSTAVVIGAMLVAPLMTPILGLAGALVNGWGARAASSSRLVIAGSLGAVALSYVLSRWTPPLIALEANTQITSRVSPTLLDLLIAVSAGAAGAFATVNSRVAASIAGVAIAVALVPPLAVVGICLAAGETAQAAGASLLFMTNFVAIVLSAAVVFVLGGFASFGVLRARASHVLRTLAPYAVLAVVILVPLVFTSEGVLAEASARREAGDAADAWLDDAPDLRVVQVDVQDDEVTVAVTGAGDLPPVKDLQADISSQIGRDVSLEVEFTPSEVVRVDGDGRRVRG